MYIHCPTLVVSHYVAVGAKRALTSTNSHGFGMNLLTMGVNRLIASMMMKNQAAAFGGDDDDDNDVCS